MKIDFKTPDGLVNIASLKEILELKKPTAEDVAAAMVLATIIFYDNRPGKLYKKTKCGVWGTGCHNPSSYKDNKTIWGIWRLELEMKSIQERFSLRLSYEYVEGGYLTADFKSRGWDWSVRSDIFFDKHKHSSTLDPRSVSITGGYLDCFMEELKSQLMPLLQIIAEFQPEPEIAHAL